MHGCVVACEEVGLYSYVNNDGNMSTGNEDWEHTNLQ